ncbi:MAG: cache domain-containing protein, partial [Desulfobacterales bacterium]|nr:cache domain-containing protein [Desulfobacterales bacterium]
MIGLFTFKTLRTRFFVLLLIPVCILLIIGGISSFIYTRNAMLEQWNEGAILKLERAAHFMEMRLTAPLKMLDSLFQARSSLSPYEVLTALHAQKGVVYAEYRHIGTPLRFGHGNMMQKRMHFQRSGIEGISKPSFNADIGRETLTVTVNLWDDTQSPISTLNIVMGFDYLLEDMVRLSWWQSNMACIVDKEGRYLAHTNMSMTGRQRLGGNGDPLEASILGRMKSHTYGTVKSEGHPPKMIAGFYKLTQAPWTIVIYAKGKTVLEPIITYRNGFVFG